MLEKAICLLICFIGTVGYTQQKTGGVEGTVYTSDGKPAAMVNVLLKDTDKGTITDNEGQFVLARIQPGTYAVEFSLIGLETKAVSITVTEGQMVQLTDIKLNVNEEQLQEVVLVAERLNQFAHKKTEFVSRLPIKNIHNPQSYTVVSNALMQEQVSTDLPSAFKSITGGGYVEGNAGFVSVYARGFRTDSKIKNGLRANVRTPVALQNIERVEVIKGPSAVIFGSGFYGGVVNLVTKKPLENSLLELSYNLGSWDLNRLTADFNTPLDKKKNVLFRVNGAFHSEESFQETERRRNVMISPAFTFKLSKRFTIDINAEYFKTNRNLNFARFVGRDVEANSWDEIKWDYYNNYSSKKLAADMEYVVTQFNADYKITNNWTSKTAFSYTDFKIDGVYLALDAIQDDLLGRSAIKFLPEKGGNFEIRQDFQGVFNFGNIENKLLVGGSYVKDYRDFTLKRGQRGFLNIDTINLDDPNAVIPEITNAGVDAIDGAIFDTEAGTENLGIYLSNAITLSKKLTILGGVRYDEFTNDPTIINDMPAPNFGRNAGYTQDKISYNGGFSYTPFDEKLSVFGNYMNGFKNVPPGQINQAGDTGNFDPEEVKQWETGLKLNLLKGKIKSTISYYNIDIDNAVLSYRGQGYAFQAQDGEIKSTGVEADLIANPFPGLNMVIGYTYNNAENKNHSNPEVNGKRLTLSPETVANFWISYKALKGKLKGIGAGFGGNYMSKIYAVGSLTNTFWAKEYTTFDATAFYQKGKYKFDLKFNNLFDKEYYNAYGIPQKPFNFILGFTYKL